MRKEANHHPMKAKPVREKRSEWTTHQAIQLYLTIEALLNQFDRDNLKPALNPTTEGKR
jgi:hypothetical protein